MRGRVAAAWLMWIACTAWPLLAHGQEAEPRSYSNAPVGTNFLIVGYAFTRGGLAFDPALPVENEHLETNSGVLAYARALNLWDLSGKFDAIVPYMSLSGSADYLNQPVTREVNGFVDPRFRLSVNFFGAPALSTSEFASYRQDLIIGASIQVSAPWGQYDPSRIVNIGTNRWWFKPELGISKSLGTWTFEFAAAGTAFTDNQNFYGGHIRSQHPLYSVQGHAIHTFASGIWISGDVTYFAGGRTSVDAIADNNYQQNWRLGATLALPIDRQDSIKLNASSGVSARTGNGFDAIAVAWQHRWDGGL